MDAATLFVIFTLHSSERRMYKLHFPSLEECAQTAKHWRRGGKPYDKTKRMFVFCATRYAIGPLADEPKAYLRITWHLPGGAERRWPRSEIDRLVRGEPLSAEVGEPVAAPEKTRIKKVQLFQEVTQ